MDTGHWIFPYEFNTDDWFGFIYRITEISTGREYIGKKQFHQYLKKAVKGRINKKRMKKESDWKTYTSSSTHLNLAIENNGKMNYTFNIESLHKTRAALVYAEVRYLILEDVLRVRLADGITPKYFNRQVSGVKFIPPIEHSEETKMKISASLVQKYALYPHWRSTLTEEEIANLNDKYYTGQNHYLYRLMNIEDHNKFINDNFMGENNPMYEKEPHNKDKSFEEEYGLDIADSLKKKLSESCGRSGENNGMYGKTHTDEQKEKWRTDPRRIHKGKANGMFGKSVTDIMPPEKIIQWKENIRKSSQGRKRKAESIEKMKATLAEKDRKRPTFTCSHCQRTIGGEANFKKHVSTYCRANEKK
jgi:Putative endonuclease segE, GIY-YIG domain/NUMOD3 motif